MPWKIFPSELSALEDFLTWEIDFERKIIFVLDFSGLLNFEIITSYVKFLVCHVVGED